jgi:hypothetical protein
MVKIDKLIAQRGICFHIRTGDVFFNGRSGKMRVKEDLISAVIKQQRCRSKKGYFQHLDFPLTVFLS